MFAKRDQNPPSSNYDRYPAPSRAAFFESTFSTPSGPPSATSDAPGEESSTGHVFTTSDVAFAATLTTSLSLGSSAITFSSPSDSTSVSDRTSSVVGSTPSHAPYPASYATSSSLPTTTASILSHTFESSHTALSSHRPTFTSSRPAVKPTGAPYGQPSRDDRHPFNGPILAVVIVPIVVVALGGLGLLLCLRRRRQALGVSSGPIADNAQVEGKISTFKDMPVNTIDATQEREPGTAPSQPHIIMSAENSSYLTGLETMSMISADMSRPSNDDPPPPYRSRSQATALPVSVRSTVWSLNPRPPLPSHSAAPVSLLSSRDVAEASPFDDVEDSGWTTPSARSISSTIYSSDASIGEARHARRSLGEQHMIGVGERSPFADPDPNEDEPW